MKFNFAYIANSTKLSPTDIAADELMAPPDIRNELDGEFNDCSATGTNVSFNAA